MGGIAGREEWNRCRDLREGRRFPCLVRAQCDQRQTWREETLFLSRRAPHRLANDDASDNASSNVMIEKMFRKIHRCFLKKPQLFLTNYLALHVANSGAPTIIEQPLSRVKLDGGRSREYGANMRG